MDYTTIIATVLIASSLIFRILIWLIVNDRRQRDTHSSYAILNDITQTKTNVEERIIKKCNEDGSKEKEEHTAPYCSQFAFLKLYLWVELYI